MKKCWYLLCFALIGCGFHLRGMLDIPHGLDSIYIVSQSSFYDISAVLKERFADYHIAVLQVPSGAHYLLTIEQDTLQENIVSVSSSTSARQYQLIETVRFKLETPHGKVVIPSVSLVATRQLTVNSDRILGSNHEEAILRKEMRQDIAEQMLNRMSQLSQEAL